MISVSVVIQSPSSIRLPLHLHISCFALLIYSQFFSIFRIFFERLRSGLASAWTCDYLAIVLTFEYQFCLRTCCLTFQRVAIQLNLVVVVVWFLLSSAYVGQFYNFFDWLLIIDSLLKWSIFVQIAAFGLHWMWNLKYHYYFQELLLCPFLALFFPYQNRGLASQSTVSVRWFFSFLSNFWLTRSLESTGTFRNYLVLVCYL